MLRITSRGMPVDGSGRGWTRAMLDSGIGASRVFVMLASESSRRDIGASSTSICSKTSHVSPYAFLFYPLHPNFEVGQRKE